MPRWECRRGRRKGGGERGEGKRIKKSKIPGLRKDGRQLKLGPPSQAQTSLTMCQFLNFDLPSSNEIFKAETGIRDDLLEGIYI